MNTVITTKWLRLSLLFLILICFFSSCKTIPFQENVFKIEYNKGSEIKDKYIICVFEETSIEEFNIAVKQVYEERLIAKFYDGKLNKGYILIKYNLKNIESLVKTFKLLHAKKQKYVYHYGSYNRKDYLFEYKGYYTQFVFKGGSPVIKGRTDAKYSIIVSFDPNCEVNLGGLKLKTNSNGLIYFKGENVVFGYEDSKFIIYIVDKNQKKVKLHKYKNKNGFYVDATGKSLGKKAKKRIEVKGIKIQGKIK